MYIGLGIVLLVLGLIFALDVITADISYVDEHALGTILIIGGILAIVISLFLTPPWRRAPRDTVVRERYVEPQAAPRETVVREEEPPLR